MILSLESHTMLMDYQKDMEKSFVNFMRQIIFRLCDSRCPTALVFLLVGAVQLWLISFIMLYILSLLLFIGVPNVPGAGLVILFAGLGFFLSNRFMEHLISDVMTTQGR